MSREDAFEEEMGLIDRIRDEDIELVLDARASGRPELADVAEFVAAVRVAVPVRLDPDADALVPTLVATAISADGAGTAETAPMRSVPARRWRPRLALAARVAVAVALLPALMAGLAFAGVTLPEPAREAMERIGLELPNQSAVDDPTTPGPDDADGGESGKANQTGSRSGRAERNGAKSDRSNRGRARGRSKRRARGHRGAARRPDRGESRGRGEPQLGGPAPIIPPGQGGTPPGHGGPSPSQSGTQSQGQSSAPQGAGPLGGTPPGQAKK